MFRKMAKSSGRQTCHMMCVSQGPPESYAYDRMSNRLLNSRATPSWFTVQQALLG